MRKMLFGVSVAAILFVCMIYEVGKDMHQMTRCGCGRF